MWQHSPHTHITEPHQLCQPCFHWRWDMAKQINCSSTLRSSQLIGSCKLRNRFIGLAWPKRVDVQSKAEKQTQKNLRDRIYTYTRKQSTAFTANKPGEKQWNALCSSQFDREIPVETLGWSNLGAGARWPPKSHLQRETHLFTLELWPRETHINIQGRTHGPLLQ